jgi:hypothetical protein
MFGRDWQLIVYGLRKSRGFFSLFPFFSRFSSFFLPRPSKALCMVTVVTS